MLRFGRCDHLPGGFLGGRLIQLVAQFQQLAGGSDVAASTPSGISSITIPKPRAVLSVGGGFFRAVDHNDIERVLLPFEPETQLLPKNGKEVRQFGSGG